MVVGFADNRTIPLQITSFGGMFSEVFNALFVTYAATELSGGGNKRSKYDDDLFPRKYSQVGIVFSMVIVVNAIDSLTGIGIWMHALLKALFHIPKVFVVVIFYIITLYLDCLYTLRRNHHQSSSLSFWSDFLPRLLRLFLRICPIYPIMAVGISFVFLFLISLFELLRIPTSILNVPIYYGTLYGPFSYIYFHVKRDVIVGSSTMALPQHCHIPIIKLESSDC
jgi:hypothetical protein